MSTGGTGGGCDNRILVVEVVDGDPVDPSLVARLPDAVEIVVVAPVGSEPHAWAAAVERLGTAAELDAAAPWMPVTDAVKEVGDDGRVIATVDRSSLVAPGLPLAVRRHVVEGSWPATGAWSGAGWAASLTARIDVIGEV